MSEEVKQPTNKREIRVVADTSEFSNLLDTARFEHMYRVATMFSESTIIPEHYRKNVGNCFIAVQMATRLGVDPFMFMQKTYVVHGKPGMEAQLAIALMNTSGLFVDAIDFEAHCDVADDPFDPSYRVRAFAVRRSTGKMIVGPWIDWALVKGEKWDSKDGSKWKTMPGMMFIYRAATFFGRMHCPERLMGMSTSDELEDVSRGDVEVSAEEIKPKRMNLREQAKSLSPSPSVGAAAPSNAPTVLDTNAGSGSVKAPAGSTLPSQPAQTTGGVGPAAKTPGGTGPSPEAGGAVGAQAAPTPPDGKKNPQGGGRPKAAPQSPDEPPAATLDDPRTVEQKADEWAQSDAAELRSALKAARVGANRQKAWVGKACEMNNVAFIDADVTDEVIRKIARDYMIFRLENE